MVLLKSSENMLYLKNSSYIKNYTCSVPLGWRLLMYTVCVGAGALLGLLRSNLCSNAICWNPQCLVLFRKIAFKNDKNHQVNVEVLRKEKQGKYFCSLDRNGGKQWPSKSFHPPKWNLAVSYQRCWEVAVHSEPYLRSGRIGSMLFMG